MSKAAGRCARVFDDLRHPLHEDRQALAAVAQEGDEAEPGGDERGDDEGGDQRHSEQARSVAAENSQAQPRCQHFDQLEHEQAGQQCRQEVQLEGKPERDCGQAPGDDVVARHGFVSVGVHQTVQ